MIKKIPFNIFKQGQYLAMDFNALMAVEQLTNRPIGEIIKRSASLDLTALTAILSVAVHEADGKQLLLTPKYYAKKIQEYLLESDSSNIDEIMEPVTKVLITTGIMGKSLYLTIFPQEETKELKKAAEIEMEEIEKNA